MKIEKQVCSLESAKRLKELRVDKDSYFLWDKTIPYLEWGVCHSSDYDLKECKEEGDKIYPAYTVAELGEMLPSGIKTYGTILSGKMEKGKAYFCGSYKRCKTFFEFIEPTEAEARAKMLIYLLENNIIKQDDINADESKGE